MQRLSDGDKKKERLLWHAPHNLQFESSKKRRTEKESSAAATAFSFFSTETEPKSDERRKVFMFSEAAYVND